MADNNSIIVVDYLSGLSVLESDGVNELITLSCLSTGLATLAQQVKLLEQPIQDDEKERRKRITFYGFGFLPQETEELLPCYFHWFGTSLCNYARLVGFLSGVSSGAFSRSATEDPKNFRIIKEYCDTYIDSIPELIPIKIWRNKVFAHFAITNPRSSDNAALLDSSVMSPISYFDGRFRVGGMVTASRGAEAELPHWSVTESYELLSPRFWPLPQV